MKGLKEEALWTAKQMLEIQKTEDTALIFQSWNQLEKYLTHLKKAFSSFDVLHAIAIKTNPHPAVLRYIVSKGFGLEAASMEEVEMAISAGIDPINLVFDSPVKTKSEIIACHNLYPEIKLNLNSLEELNRIPENPNFTIGLRINPMAETGSPELYHVSHDESKFGEPISNREAIQKACLKYPISQLHIHSGSALGNLQNAVNAIADVVALADEINELLRLNKITRRIERIDIGGGLKPELLSNEPSQMMRYAEMLYNQTNLRNYQVVTEFGQWCHFYCGFALSEVEYVLQRGNKQLAYVHLGADFLLRDAYVIPRGIEFVALTKNFELNQETNEMTDIAGPLCFAGDYLQKDTQIPKLKEGDHLLMLGTGSNSYALWSRHCSRAIPKIIGVDFEKQQLEVLSERTKFH